MNDMVPRMLTKVTPVIMRMVIMSEIWGMNKLTITKQQAPENKQQYIDFYRSIGERQAQRSAAIFHLISNDNCFVRKCNLMENSILTLMKYKHTHAVKQRTGRKMGTSKSLGWKIQSSTHNFTSDEFTICLFFLKLAAVRIKNFSLIFLCKNIYKKPSHFF